MKRAELTRQLENPQHVYIRMPRGTLLRHSDSYPGPPNNPVWERGEPVRFTRLAAEKLVTNNPFLQGAELIEIRDDGSEIILDAAVYRPGRNGPTILR